MNRRAFAARLSILVALSGLLPIAGVGVAAIESLSRRGENQSKDALRAVAEQASQRIGSYLEQQRTQLRALVAAVAGAPDAEARLRAVPVDAPSLRDISIHGPGAPQQPLPAQITAAQLAEAEGGREVRSAMYLAADSTPAMDLCLPFPGRRGQAVCATLDLLELWRLVQHIRVGTSGYALAFDQSGKLIAAGAGNLRAAVLRGSPIAQSPSAVTAAKSVALAPQRYVSATGEEVLAGWAWLPEPGWSVVVEEPVRDALRGARGAQLTLTAVAVIALLLSIGVGIWQSMRVLTHLEVEERWRTAGRIATGITHDMGHRLAILQQTAALAESADPAFLPLIRDNLRNEVATLKKFVGDFADLSREVRPADLLPLDLNAFLESVRRTATPHAEKAGVKLAVQPGEPSPWVRADRYLLERAALNLVYNAIEASARGSSVQLAVRRQQFDAKEETAVLEVRDHGMGIPPDRLPRIFDAFKSTKRTGAHVGMGLPNVRRIITAHGGLVDATSEVGRGSTFTISLPLVTTPEAGRAG